MEKIQVYKPVSKLWKDNYLFCQMIHSKDKIDGCIAQDKKNDLTEDKDKLIIRRVSWWVYALVCEWLIDMFLCSI